MLFLVKILFVLVVAILIRGTFPRSRVDKFLEKSWGKIIFYMVFILLEFILIMLMTDLL